MSFTKAQQMAGSPQWPDDPYKGLTFYGPEDVPLFAGRENDVRRVARVLGRGETRVLLLHGGTGCGKSSFLRAGLIPFLEGEIASFQFARDPETEYRTALFVRSTSEPLARLALKVFTSIQQDLAAEEREILEPFSRPMEFAFGVSEDPELLVKALEVLARAHPRTPMLVVDQAEEILTLKPGAEGDSARGDFFRFLAYLSYANLDCKLILTFRTEYHGQIYSALRQAKALPERVDDYYLKELGVEEIIEAIERPTLERLNGMDVSPRDKYGFVFEEGLPRQIAEDIVRSQITGGLLPVLQIVCRQLYRQARKTQDKLAKKAAKKAAKVEQAAVEVATAVATRDATESGEEPRSEMPLAKITAKDYGRLGRVEGQMDLHLQMALDERFRPPWLSERFLIRDTLRWREILAELALEQPGGNITTDVVSRERLRKIAWRKGWRPAKKGKQFDATVDLLADERWRILRPVQLTQKDTEEPIECFSLGHDVIGSVLQKWRRERHEASRTMRGGFWFWAIVILGGTLTFVQKPWLRYSFLAIGGLLLLTALLPHDRKGFRWLYNRIYGFFLDFVQWQSAPTP